MSCLSFTFAQDAEKTYTYQTFKSTTLINQQTVETIQKNRMDFRVGHRFGDFLGDAGGWPTFYGLESANDVMIGLFYGITDNLNVGLSRTKGSPFAPSQNVNGSLKYKILSQTEDFSTPVTATLHLVSSVTTASSLDDPASLRNFSKASSRWSYASQVIIGSKISEAFSLQVTPTWVHRNRVVFGDSNDLFALGLGSRLQLSKHFGIISEVTLPFSDFHTSENGYYPSLGLGLEMETAGHVFQINFTNSGGISETDYIPFTRNADISEGQFRLGFTISRQFNI